MKKILVTGACGWLGAALVKALLARGDAVVALDVAVSPAMTALTADHANTLTPVACDLGQWPQVLDAMHAREPDAVIHAGAVVGVVQCAQDPFTAQHVNVAGSLHLFEAMRRVGVKRVIHVSSEETYGDFTAPLIDEDHPQKPISLYGATKLAAEHLGRVYACEHGLECINVRTCWVYGPSLPRLRVPRTFIEAALRGEPHHLAQGGDLAVDQVYIADAVAGVLLALDKPVHRYDSYHIATGAASTLADTAAAVNQAIAGARISVGTGGPYRHGGTLASAVKGALDIRRAQAELGYQSRYDLQRGIQATIDAAINATSAAPASS